MHEQVEHVGQEVGRDADARVPDADGDFPARPLGREPDRAAPRRVLGSVAQEVADDLGEPCRVGVQPDRLGGQRDRESMRAGLGGRADHLDRLLDDGGEQHGLSPEGDLAVRDTRDVEQVVHQAGEVAHLSVRHVHEVLAVGHVELEQVERGAQRGEGIAELVGQHREELVLATIGIGELGRALFELFGQTLALGDVRADADHAGQPPGGVAHHAPLGGHPPEGAVGTDGAELDVVAWPLLHGARDGVADSVAIVRVDEREKGRVRTAEAAGREAVDGFEVLRPVELPGEQIPVPGAHPAGVERYAEPSLAHLESRVVSGAAMLGGVALGKRRAEEERADGHHRVEELERDEVLVRCSRRERPPALHRAQDRQARCDERHGDRTALAEPQRCPDDEREDLVGQGTAHEPRANGLDEHEQADAEEAAEQGDRLHDPARLPAEPRRTRPDEQHRRHDEVPHRITDPPHPPYRCEGVPRLNAAEAEARDADRGADDGAREGGEHHEDEHVLQPLERGVESDAAQEPGADHGLQRVADGDAARGAERLVVGGVGEERPGCDPRPGAVAEHQHRSEGDPRRRPDERHLLGDEREPQPELCRHDVDRAGAENDRDRGHVPSPRHEIPHLRRGLCPALR